MGRFCLIGHILPGKSPARDGRHLAIRAVYGEGIKPDRSHLAGQIAGARRPVPGDAVYGEGIKNEIGAAKMQGPGVGIVRAMATETKAGDGFDGGAGGASLG